MNKNLDKYASCKVEELLVMALCYRLAALWTRRCPTSCPPLLDLLRLWMVYRLPFLVRWRQVVRRWTHRLTLGLRALRRGQWQRLKLSTKRILRS